MVTKTSNLLKSMKPQVEKRVPIADEMFLPNHSGIAVHPEAVKKFVPYTGANASVDLGANNLTVDTNTLFVDAANNRIGIGTKTPQRQVSIQATIPILQLTNPTCGTTADDGLLIFQSALSTIIENGEAGAMTFRTSATNRMVIATGGDVSISNSLDVVKNLTGATIMADNGFTGTITTASLVGKTITISGGLVIGFA
jgi:hypothetical protein